MNRWVDESDDLMADMAAQASSLKAGAYFVTFTKGLNSKDFEVVERKRYKMSWGPATVYIQRRLNDDGTSFDMEGLQVLRKLPLPPFLTPSLHHPLTHSHIHIHTPTHVYTHIHT